MKEFFRLIGNASIGLASLITIEKINALIGIFVGLITILYMCIQIKRVLKKIREEEKRVKHDDKEKSS